MLATFGLGRIEACLDGDTVSPQDVEAFVEQARADCAKPAAPAIAPTVHEAAESGYQRYVFAESVEDLPERVLIHHGGNPDFRPTRHAYRV